MNILTVIMLGFAVLGAIDRIIGNRFGLGREFERGFMILGPLALSMFGMIIIAPYLAHIMSPVFGFIGEYTPIDPSALVALIFPNDSGGAHLAVEVAADAGAGAFNGLVVAAMFAATLSYTLPLCLEVVEEKNMKDVLLGILCGIITIPVGCFVGGLVGGVSPLTILFNLIPCLVLTVVVVVGLLRAPNVSLKIFNGFGIFIKILITLGLVIGMFSLLLDIELVSPIDSVDNAARLVLMASATLAGAFPMVFVISKLLKKPLRAMGKRLGINDTAATGLLCSIASNSTTVYMIADMDRKGIVLNSAFMVSAAFTVGAHLAFTLAFAPEWLPAVIVGKLVAGFLSIPVALFLFKRVNQPEAPKIEGEKGETIGENT